MKILRNYILREFFVNFSSSLLLITFIMVLGNLIKISDMIVKGLGILDALKIFSFFIPYTLRFTLPLSFLLGILFTLGVFTANNEIIAINVAGVSIFKILKFFLIVGVIFSLCLFLLNDRFIPNFHYYYRSVVKNIYTKNLSALIEPGVFLDNFKNFILYVSDRDGQKLKNIFIYNIDENKAITKVTFARKAEFVAEQNKIKLKLEDGFRDEPNPQKNQEVYRLNFKIFFMEIPFEEKKEIEIKKKASDMKLAEIKKYIGYFKNKNDIPTDFLIEIHKRMSLSLSILVFILLGFGVSLTIKHREKTINFGIAFFIAGLYYLLSLLGETLIEYKLLLPVLGMWLPNIIIALSGFYLIYKNVYIK